MLKLRTVIIVVLSVLFLYSRSQASTDYTWTTGDYNIGGQFQYHGADLLNTYNNVTVNMFVGGDVDVFNMYDNSKLTMYDGYISTLNLYSDATAIIKGGDIHYLWIDPTTTGWVKLYAYDVEVAPQQDSQGRLDIHGYWLADNSFFDIELLNGISTWSHIQIVPEPISLALFGLGAMAVFRKRAR